MSAWTCRSTDGKAAEIVPPRLRIPYWKGLGADTEEKHEPASDINTEGADSLKALDPKRPIREAGSPLIVIATALACRRARSCQGMAWQGRSMPQGWGDNQPVQILRASTSA